MSALHCRAALAQQRVVPFHDNHRAALPVLSCLSPIPRQNAMNCSGHTITGQRLLTPPPHEPGVLPKWLHDQGVNLIIAGGMGQRAQGLFNENVCDH